MKKLTTAEKRARMRNDPIYNAVSSKTVARKAEQALTDEKEHKVYRNWCNWILKGANIDHKVESFRTDLSDGVCLNLLCEAFSGRAQRYRKTCSNDFQKTDNINLALAWFKRKGLSFSVTSQDILKGDLRQVLGFFWMLIQKYQLVASQDMSFGGGGKAKEGESIYDWVRKYISGYPGVDAMRIENPQHFRDGKLLSYMVHKNAPDSIDMQAVTEDRNTPGKNLNTALSEAYSQLGVPLLMEAQDLLDANPHEPTLLTYLYAFRATVENSKHMSKHRADIEKAEQQRRELEEQASQLMEIKQGAEQARVALLAEQERLREAEELRKQELEAQRLAEEAQRAKEREKMEAELAKLRREKLEMLTAKREAEKTRKQNEAENARILAELLQLKDSMAAETEKRDREDAERRAREMEEAERARKAAEAAEAESKKNRDLAEEQRAAEQRARDAEKALAEARAKAEEEARLRAEAEAAARKAEADAARRQREAEEAAKLKREAEDARRRAEEEAARRAREAAESNARSASADSEAEARARAAEQQARDALTRADEEARRRKAAEEEAERRRLEAEEAARRQREAEAAAAAERRQRERDAAEIRKRLEAQKATREEMNIDCHACGDKLRGLVVRVDKQNLYHEACFCCFTCKDTFAQYYYPYRGQSYCKDHFMEEAGLKCSKCNQMITDGAPVIARGRKWHQSCFSCTECRQPFEKSYFFKDGSPYCEKHYHKVSGNVCAACLKAINSDALKALGSRWHRSCFKCSACATVFAPAAGGKVTPFFRGNNGKPVCDGCRATQQGSLVSASPARRSSDCARCNKKVDKNTVSAMGKLWHDSCFNCHICHQVFDSSFFNVDGQPRCEGCKEK